MHCQYCGLINGEDDHRCLHCGRRIAGIAISAPTSYIGATALAVAAMPAREQDPMPASRPAVPRAESPAQAPLFQAPQASPQKVIPFEQLQRQLLQQGRAAARYAQPQPAAPEGAPSRKPPAPPRAPAKKTASPTGQASLDFHPNVSQERILSTGVPAQVYGDGRVAPPMRRITAGAMDVSMVLLGFGLFAGAARFWFSHLGLSPGLVFGSGKTAWITLAASMILISLLYGLLWAVAKRETAGMNWTQLHLVTFDGSPLDSRDRAIRFISAWLSYCSGGLGLLWALADEERLAFHDHISKTYPAEKAISRPFVRQRS